MPLVLSPQPHVWAVSWDGVMLTQCCSTKPTLKEALLENQQRGPQAEVCFNGMLHFASRNTLNMHLVYWGPLPDMNR